MKVYAIVGAGGFGREVAPLAQEMISMRNEEEFQIIFVDDNQTEKTSTELTSWIPPAS